MSFVDVSESNPDKSAFLVDFLETITRFLGKISVFGCFGSNVWAQLVVFVARYSGGGPMDEVQRLAAGASHHCPWP